MPANSCEQRACGLRSNLRGRQALRLAAAVSARSTAFSSYVGDQVSSADTDETFACGRQYGTIMTVEESSHRARPPAGVGRLRARQRRRLQARPHLHDGELVHGARGPAVNADCGDELLALEVDGALHVPHDAQVLPVGPEGQRALVHIYVDADNHAVVERREHPRVHANVCPGNAREHLVPCGRDLRSGLLLAEATDAGVRHRLENSLALLLVRVVELLLDGHVRIHAGGAPRRPPEPSGALAVPGEWHRDVRVGLRNADVLPGIRRLLHDFHLEVRAAGRGKLLVAQDRVPLAFH
mmetsp:Transcript_33038/g.87325  ORF Transcript_33038/g.87325 Transcript_33038/m.87325 type:complete len:297 (-) Transcript_33038:322-1212(-)